MYTRLTRLNVVFRGSGASLSVLANTLQGRPKLTWRRSVEKEMKEVGCTWKYVQHWASDRQHFSSFVTALCATDHEVD